MVSGVSIPPPGAVRLIPFVVAWPFLLEGRTVKDYIATADTMQTTAGSLALVNSRLPADAVLVSKLRSAGAIVLGKANLSEWANFRGFGQSNFNGWSARGDKTRDPYLLSFAVCGSSSGSAVAAAAISARRRSARRRTD